MAATIDEGGDLGEVVTVDCPFCNGRVREARPGDGRHYLEHDLPACQKFDDETADDFFVAMTAARKRFN